MVRKMECYIMLLSRLASVGSPPRCPLSPFLCQVKAPTGGTDFWISVPLGSRAVIHVCSLLS